MYEQGGLAWVYDLRQVLESVLTRDKAEDGMGSGLQNPEGSGRPPVILGGVVAVGGGPPLFMDIQVGDMLDVGEYEQEAGPVADPQDDTGGTAEVMS